MSPKYTKELCNSMKKFDRSVSLLCWAYNEEQLIEKYLARINTLLVEIVEDYEIVVIDDCSTDKTNEIVTRLAKVNPRIRLLRNSENLNVGLSSQKAIMGATKEYLFWQTIDWSYDISLLRIYLELLRTYDVVAGVRRAPVITTDNIAVIKPFLGLLKLFGVKHITRRSDTIPKAIISIINYSMIRFLFNVPLSDYQNVVFYKTHIIQSIKYESKSSFSNPEALIKCFWRGCSIVEVPISFIPRQEGTAKGTRPKAILSSVKDIVTLWFKWIIKGNREIKGKGKIRRLTPSEWENKNYRSSPKYLS